MNVFDPELVEQLIKQAEVAFDKAYNFHRVWSEIVFKLDKQFQSAKLTASASELGKIQNRYIKARNKEAKAYERRNRLNELVQKAYDLQRYNFVS